MGHYVLDENKTAQLRPVYKKTDRDWFIFYSGKAEMFTFYIRGVKIFICIYLQQVEGGLLVTI